MVTDFFEDCPLDLHSLRISPRRRNYVAERRHCIRQQERGTDQAWPRRVPSSRSDLPGIVAGLPVGEPTSIGQLIPTPSSLLRLLWTTIRSFDVFQLETDIASPYHVRCGQKSVSDLREETSAPMHDPPSL